MTGGASRFAAAPVRLDIPDADLVLWPEAGVGVDPRECLARLVNECEWREERITLWGRTYLQPRRLAWYGDAGASYRYSGKRYDPLPWTPLLAQLRERIQAIAGARFNSVLANWYRDHRDSMGMHSDHEPELGPEPVIASYSVGAERTLVLRHRFDRGQKNRRIALPSGSLLVMRGPTQRCWQHAIPKIARECGARINLTFRLVRGCSRTSFHRHH